MKSMRRGFLKSLIGGGAIAAVAALPAQLMAFGRIRAARANPVGPCSPYSTQNRDVVGEIFHIAFPYPYVTSPPLFVYGGPGVDGNGMFYTWGTYTSGSTTTANRLQLVAANTATVMGGTVTCTQLSTSPVWAFLVTGVPYGTTQNPTQFQLQFNGNNRWRSPTICQMVANP